MFIHSVENECNVTAPQGFSSILPSSSKEGIFWEQKRKLPARSCCFYNYLVGLRNVPDDALMGLRDIPERYYRWDVDNSDGLRSGSNILDADLRTAGSVEEVLFEGVDQ